MRSLKLHSLIARITTPILLLTAFLFATLGVVPPVAAAGVIAVNSTSPAVNPADGQCTLP